MKIGYARVSTVDQNTDLQLDALNGEGCELIYSEKISSTKVRPEWESCYKNLRKGDVLVVWKLDRIGRSLLDLVNIIYGLQERGVVMQLLNPRMDTEDAMGRMFISVIAMMAEYELSGIQERTKAGLKAARKRGRVGGRKQSLTEAQVKMAINNLADPDVTVKSMAEFFGVSRSALYAGIRRYKEANPTAEEQLSVFTK